jgi:nitrate reductase NapE component
LHARRRHYLVEHLVFATHLFAILIMAIVGAALAGLVMGFYLVLVAYRLMLFMLTVRLV